MSTGSISPQYHVVYDERFATVVGKVTDTAFDAELWESLFELQAFDHHLDVADQRDPTVTQIAEDLYRSFIDNRDDDLPPSPVSEGDDSDSETSESEDEEEEPEEPVYRTRSGRVIRNQPQYASTLHVPDQPEPNPADRYQPYLRELHLAGGNSNSKIRSRKPQNENLHRLNWDPTTLLTSSSADTLRMPR